MNTRSHSSNEDNTVSLEAEGSFAVSRRDVSLAWGILAQG